MPQLQFEGRNVDDVLARVHTEAGSGATILSAERVRTGGIAGFFARERVRVTVELPEDMPEDEVGPSTRPSSLLEVADQVSDAEQRDVGSRLGSGFSAALEAASSNLSVGNGALGQGVPVRHDALVGSLVRLGLPVELVLADLIVPEKLADDPVAALGAALGGLPAPPPLPTLPGGVLAVVGRGDRALELARALAAELGGDADEVVVASPSASRRPAAPWLGIADAATAAERRRGWRRRSQVTVVAVEASMWGRGAQWAREVLDGLEPEATWGVVDARGKTDDVVAWAKSLGGLDALALERVGGTVSPASVLGARIPVARIEGHRANPALWAQLLADRLTAASAPRS